MTIKSILKKIENAGHVASGYVQVVNTTRAYAEMSTPLAPGARAFNRSIVPLHIIGLISVAFEPFKMGKSLLQMVKAPKYLKIFPLLKLGTSCGNILDSLTTTIWICEQLKVSGIQVLSAASVPLGGVALGLQALGIGILSWRVYSIHQQWKAVEKKLGTNPTMVNYGEAVLLLTNKPAAMKERYIQKFFGVLSKNQKGKVQAIYNQAISNRTLQDGVPAQLMERMFKLLKEHHFQQKVQNTLSIALMIIGIVGMTLIAFAPSPIAPIAWGILAGVGTASLLLVAYGIYQHRQFNQSLQRTLLLASVK